MCFISYTDAKRTTPKMPLKIKIAVEDLMKFRIPMRMNVCIKITTAVKIKIIRVLGASILNKFFMNYNYKGLSEDLMKSKYLFGCS